MLIAPRIRHVVALFGLALLPFACGDKAEVDGGGGGPGSETDVCAELFDDDCGTPCDTENSCADGMHCRAGKCHAECGEGFACPDGRPCASGRCTGIQVPTNPDCEPQTCEEVGFECGVMVDECGNVVDCADEGLSCSANEVCAGNPTKCVTGTHFDSCDVCDHIPDCSAESQFTVLSGRVVSPGRSDDDTANQVGIPNAVVYILRSADVGDLPAIARGLPEGGESCDRCDEQDYGPVLVGAVTDATGHFELEEYIPVDTEFLLVVQAGKFRRATPFTIPASDACTTTTLPTALPDNPTRLPRTLDDGLAVNIPHIAVSTGMIDAMECVFYKMGLDEETFGPPASDRPVHIYHGANHLDRPAGGAWALDDTDASCADCAACGNGNGGGSSNCREANCGGSARSDKFAFLNANCTARSCAECAECDNSNCREANCGGTSAGDRTSYLAGTCAAYLDTRFLEDAAEIGKYDMVVLDCQGQRYDHDHNIDSEDRGARRAAHGERVREYVNRGGRMFASHLSHTWLYDNGSELYAEGAPWETGLASVADWEYQYNENPNSGTGQITLPEYWEDGQSDWTVDNTSPRIESFADWMVGEGITNATDDHEFELADPRSQCLEPGEHTEVFVDGVSASGPASRVQQFSFNTPYAAPEEAACGRVAYSGFHVAAEGDGSSSAFLNELFPAHCGGDLSDQEKVLLYMLFDLGACVGSDPPGISCQPATCPTDACGFMPDGCGGVVDCGTCVPTPIK